MPGFIRHVFHSAGLWTWACPLQDLQMARTGVPVQPPVGPLAFLSITLHGRSPAPTPRQLHASHIQHILHPGPTCPGSPVLSAKELASLELGTKWLPPSAHHSTIQRQRWGSPPASPLPRTLGISHRPDPATRLLSSHSGGTLGPRGTWFGPQWQLALNVPCVGEMEVS